MTKKLVLVDCLSQFRIRYAIEVEDDIDRALDIVNDQKVEEMSQEYLGEMTTSYREITEEEYLHIFDKDNDYLRSWSDEQKKKLIYRINSEE
jgi:hypothetical protein